MNGSGLLLVLLLVLALGAGVALWIRGEGTPPAIDAPAQVLVGAAGLDLTLRAHDEGSGIRSLRVEVGPEEAPIQLFEASYIGNLISGGTRTEAETTVALRDAMLETLPEASNLRVHSRDWSWRGFFSGNESTLEIPLRVDLEPPSIQVETGLMYVTQGGAGTVNYRVSDDVTADGVKVGEQRYRGYPLPGGSQGQRIALFAIPADAPEGVVPRVFATDEAGNEATARWPARIKQRAMPEGNVTLGASFLENVVPRLTRVAQGADLKAAFHRVNTELRAENEVTIRAALADSASTPLFEGALAQLANSKVTSRFAERRTYFVEGDPVSKAIHYGYDLASTSSAPITAAAAGRIVYADELGIYGNCVLVDHGLGLGTLYGHLSRIDAAVGDDVEKGSTLGLSGATGLAGGDHLHFAVAVGGTYVDPLEWWDASWVAKHIDVRLRPLTANE